MVDEARCSSSGPLKYGVPGAETDCSRELSSAGGPLALDVSDRSDELLMVRPGMPGRRTGERYEAGGLKERAKLAMAASAAAADAAISDGLRAIAASPPGVTSQAGRESVVVDAASKRLLEATSKRDGRGSETWGDWARSDSRRRRRRRLCRYRCR